MPSSSLYRLILVSVASVFMMTFQPVWAEDEFNLRILELDTPLENTDTLKNFIHNNGLLPGNYLTTVMWGKEVIVKRTITYSLSADKQQLLPALTKADLRDFGVKVEEIPRMRELDDSETVTDITGYIDGARYDFQLDSQTLHLVIPQIYRNQRAAGTINPKYWDEGVPAVWASYQLSRSQQQSDYGKTTSTWLGMNSGVNLGPWRVRNNSTWSDASGWDTISSSVQRNIKALKSQLELGQIYTNGELFDSVQMTGVKLETDTSMLPESQQGFAPVVRGIANSDAKVTIKQNGYTVYQTNVPPGPFEISDLSQVTAGADLDVSVEEADGSTHSFIQASSSVPILQREGALKYTAALGKYRSDTGEEEPEFGQATLIYGLPRGVTVYGGVLGASLYRAALLGMGADMKRFGSASLDITTARTTFDDGRHDASGLSWRAQYSKDIPDTHTTLTLASYRYSTSNFYTFQEAIDQREHEVDDDIYAYRSTNNRRSRLQLNLSQQLGEWGSAYMNAYQQDYWGMNGHERSVSAGVSSSWQNVSWSLSYTFTQTPNTDDDQQVAFMVNIPLSSLLADSWASYSMNTSNAGHTSHQVGLGGTALENNNLSYNLQQSYTRGDAGYGASLSGRYRGSAGEMGLGYSYSGDNRQLNYSAQGAVVAHEYGVTLGQTVRDAFAIVHIPHGSDVKVQNGRGIYTDYFGNAIVPTLTAYRHNSVTVNTQERTDIDIEAATQDVVPTKGAVVSANFDARVGKRALVTLMYHSQPVPFGAVVVMENTTAIVGDEGEVYLTGLNGSVPFSVQWGEGQDRQCSGRLDAPAQETSVLFKTTVTCQQKETVK